MINLKILKFSENNFRSLFLDVLFYMKNYYDFSIELYGNLWDCFCKLENFLEFLFLYKINVFYLDMLVCYFFVRLFGTKLFDLV